MPLDVFSTYHVTCGQRHREQARGNASCGASLRGVNTAPSILTFASVRHQKSAPVMSTTQRIPRHKLQELLRPPPPQASVSCADSPAPGLFTPSRGCSAWRSATRTENKWMWVLPGGAFKKKLETCPGGWMGRGEGGSGKRKRSEETFHGLHFILKPPVWQETCKLALMPFGSLESSPLHAPSGKPGAW